MKTTVITTAGDIVAEIDTTLSYEIGEELSFGSVDYVVVHVDITGDFSQVIGVRLKDDAPPEIKDTNPKDDVGITKSPMSVIPLPSLHALGLAMMEGALKYGRHNYRDSGIRYSVYYDAVMRHMSAWWEGENIDPDSGLPHPIKAAACLVILFDALVQENGNDDRPPPSPEGWLDGMNEHAKGLLARFPNPKPPHVAGD